MKRKIVKIRQFFEYIIVPGLISIIIYIIILIACILVGIRFSSLNQLNCIAFIVVCLTWKIVFYFSQDLVEKILNSIFKKSKKIKKK